MWRSLRLIRTVTVRGFRAHVRVQTSGRANFGTLRQITGGNGFSCSPITLIYHILTVFSGDSKTRRIHIQGGSIPLPAPTKQRDYAQRAARGW